MDQFNKNVYKRRGLFDEFTGSCLGKLIIAAAFIILLCFLAAISVPGEKEMLAETDDNIRQCIQDNIEKKGDIVDELVWNIGRTFTAADTTLNDKEALQTFAKYNAVAVFDHGLYSTARISNGTHPEGVRVTIGFFGFVISTIQYSDIVMDVGPIRGNYEEGLIKTIAVPDDYMGDSTNINTYHYEGNPDN